MKNSKKIHRVSSALYYTCFAVMAAWSILVIATLINIWYRPGALADYLNELLVPTLIRMGEADLVRSIPAASILFAPSVLGIYALWRLSKLFDLWRQAVYFTTEAATHLFVFSIIAVFNHLFGTLLFATADFILTIGVPETPYGWPLRINGDEISMLINYGAFLTVSWILLEATKIAEEHSEFV